MLHNWEWTSAETEFKKAIEINPAYPSAHHWYSEYWEATGYLDKAIVEAKTAQEHDPLSLIINANLADLFYFPDHIRICKLVGALKNIFRQHLYCSTIPKEFKNIPLDPLKSALFHRSMFKKSTQALKLLPLMSR